MSARIPARRLGQFALAALRPRSTYWIPSARISTDASKPPESTDVSTSSNSTDVSQPSKPQKNQNSAEPKFDPDLHNPLLEEYLTRKKKGPLGRPKMREGGLSEHATSLFHPDRELPGWHENLTPEEERKLKKLQMQKEKEAQAAKDRELITMNTDPDPIKRLRLERKLVIAGVGRRGRTTKAEKIARTERQSVFTSQALPTSVKKLQKVIRQIAGKTVDEALVQLRFSPKKVARDVIKGLEIARNEAIVARGMGISREGKVKSIENADADTELEVKKENTKTEEKDADTAADTEEPAEIPEGTPGAIPEYPTETQPEETKTKETKAERRLRKQLMRPTSILLKNGTRKLVRDPTEIYIDQAWVGKSSTWKTPEFRARGKVNLLTHRTTTFSVLLKEEKTRIRLSDEIKKKIDKRKLWLPLPDRPVTAQRQYCLW